MNHSFFRILTALLFLSLCHCKGQDTGTSENSSPTPAPLPQSPEPHLTKVHLFDFDQQKKITLEGNHELSLTEITGDLTLIAEVNSDVDKVVYNISDSIFERTHQHDWALTDHSGSEWTRYPFKLDWPYSISAIAENTDSAVEGPKTNFSLTLTHPNYTTELSMHSDCQMPDLEAQGNIWYIDPVNGSIAGDGSEESPWRTLQEVIEQNLFETRQGKTLPFDGTGELVGRNVGAPIQPGDTIYLKSGNHGDVYIRGAYNQDYIKILPAPGAKPVINSIQLLAASKWYISGVSFLSTSTTLLYAVNHAFHGPTDHIVLENSILKSIEDSSSWTDTDWVNLASSAVNITGHCSTVHGNSIENVNFGVRISGRNGVISFNKIKNFSGDGIRAGASNILVRGNHISENFNVDDNHDDGIQSFTFGDPIENLVIDSNTIIQTKDPSRPHQGGLQGIGLFDGFFDDLVVTNNIVIVEAPHGIAVYGTNNGYVANNSVVGNSDPWIMVRSHKNGTASSGLVENNLAARFISDTNVVVQDNMVFSDPVEHFVAFDVSSGNFDLHLRKTSSARGAANSSSRDLVWDHDGYLRGSSDDLGALTFRESLP